MLKGLPCIFNDLPQRRLPRHGRSSRPARPREGWTSGRARPADAHRRLEAL